MLELATHILQFSAQNFTRGRFGNGFDKDDSTAQSLVSAHFI